MLIVIIILCLILIFNLYSLFSLFRSKPVIIENEIDTYRKSRITDFEVGYKKNQEEIFRLKFHEWRLANEFEIRRKAKFHSKEILEEIIAEEFSMITRNLTFNPKDVKFVGRFIDFIIFDGLSDDELSTIYFVEIKNKAHLDIFNYRMRVKDCIEKQNYKFKEISL